jgi:RNA polymerase sigma-70 factor (ECF subfamily)
VLDPEVVLRVDSGARIAPRTVRGAAEVAREAFTYAPEASLAQPALVNGVAGFVVVSSDGAPISVAALSVADGRVVALDILTDRERLANLDLSDFGA